MKYAAWVVAASLCLGNWGCASRLAPPPATTPSQPVAGETKVPPKAKIPIYAYLSPFYWTNKIFSKKGGPPQAQPPVLIGTVRMVNKEDGFVLIDAVTYQAAPGDLLVCISNKAQTANLRTSTLMKPPFIIADIASGSPSPGDRVFKQ